MLRFNFTPGPHPCAWQRPPARGMRAPAIVYATRRLLESLDARVIEQLENIATLPGIVNAAYAMPDAHQGYGFPIGGVAAFDARLGGVISAGGVGFDIACGVRTLLTGMDAGGGGTPFRRRYPGGPPWRPRSSAGVASRGSHPADGGGNGRHVNRGAGWAVSRGYGAAEDLRRIESGGAIAAGRSGESVRHRPTPAGRRHGHPGASGNHYLEVQRVAEIYDARAAAAFELRAQTAVVSIHCGSRGLGHQVGNRIRGTDAAFRPALRLHLPDPELACAPIDSPDGRAYLDAMRAAANCALANRQIIAELVRRVFRRLFLRRACRFYSTSRIISARRKLFKPAACGVKCLCIAQRRHPRLAPGASGSPAGVHGRRRSRVLVGGSMGASSYVLAGEPGNEDRAFSSPAMGAGPALSSSQFARKQWRARGRGAGPCSARESPPAVNRVSSLPRKRPALTKTSRRY